MLATDAEPILDLIESFRRSKTMFAAVTLGLFDHLEAHPALARDIAASLQLHPSALSRLLDACVGLGLLDCDSEGRYTNRPVASAYLCRTSPTTLAGYILYSDRVLYPLWSHLDDALRQGTHRWRQAFAFDGPIFTSFFKTPESRHDFLLGMHGLGLLTSPHAVRAFDLSGFRRLVDLGGATGHLPMAAREEWPHLETAVFDLPGVVEVACDFVQDTPVELLSGDFFTDPLPPADLYALGRILHDWTEDKILFILRKIHASLPAGGGLLIVEKLLDEDRRGPVSAHLQSLNMLVCTEGRERTLSEYDALLRQAGFVQVEGRRTGAWLDAVLARKP